MPAAQSVAGAPARFGALLRRWRKTRAFSQLQLSEIVGYSQRHLSFLESGRSQPTRASVLALCDALGVPLRDRNDLLTAAGLAPMFSSGALGDEPLEAIVSSIKALIDRQAPMPTLLVDDIWNLVHANHTALAFFTDLIGAQKALVHNVLEACFDRRVLRPHIQDWPGVAARFLQRLRLDLVRDPNNRPLGELAERLARLAGPDFAPPTTVDAVSSPVQTVTFLRDRQPLTFFTMIANVGHAHDVNLSGLHVETFVAADGATRLAMEGYST